MYVALCNAQTQGRLRCLCGIILRYNSLSALAGFLLVMRIMMSLTAPGSLGSRILEPLAHPWSAVTGGALSVGMLSSDVPVTALRVALRLLRLLLAL
jgi:hypothetical protein